MADPATPINTGEENTNTPAGIGLDPEAQFRTLSKRLEEVAKQIEGVAKPKEFRLADILQLAVIVIGFVVAILPPLA